MLCAIYNLLYGPDIVDSLHELHPTIRYVSYSKRLFLASPFNPLLPFPHGPHWQCVTKGIWAFLGNGSPHDQAQSPLSVTFSPLAGEKEALNNRGRSAGDGGVSWVWELAHSLLVSSLTLRVHLRPPQGAFIHPLLLITQKQPCLLLPCSLFKEKLLETDRQCVKGGTWRSLHSPVGVLPISPQWSIHYKVALFGSYFHAKQTFCIVVFHSLSLDCYAYHIAYYI